MHEADELMRDEPIRDLVFCAGAQRQRAVLLVEEYLPQPRAALNGLFFVHPAGDSFRQLTERLHEAPHPLHRQEDEIPFLAPLTKRLRFGQHLREACRVGRAYRLRRF